MLEQELLQLAETQDKKLITPEKHHVNDYYGHATIIKKFLGLPNNISLPVVIDHGAKYIDFIWSVDLNSAMPNFFCASEEYKNAVWCKKSTKPAMAIGPLIHYADIDFNIVKEIKKCYSKILIVFPHHSSHYITSQFDQNGFCEQIKSYSKDFDKIYICLYWKDVLLERYKLYYENGFECITAGHIYNPNFLIRLKSYLYACSAILTPAPLGTEVTCSIYMNKPVIYLPKKLDYTLNADVPRPNYDVTFDGQSIDFLEKVFPPRYDETITKEQLEVVARYGGLGQNKSKEELLSFLFTDVYKKTINTINTSPNHSKDKLYEDFLNSKKEEQKMKNREEILLFVNSNDWYHSIDLGNGIITPGRKFDQIWNLIREVRSSVDYRDKLVLDLASFDGMWAFEAEKMGAKNVVATDVYYEKTLKRFLFCKEVLNSDVIPYYNVSPYNLSERLDVFLEENWGDQKPYDRLFDIVQHFGLLYHLQNPMLSLAQARSVIKAGGTLVLETAVVTNVEQPIMLFNCNTKEKRHIYDDVTTWWAPTLSCLIEMLKVNLFETVISSVKIVNQHVRDGLQISRVALIARALSPEETNNDLYREMSRNYRNPGLMIH